MERVAVGEWYWDWDTTNVCKLQLNISNLQRTQLPMKLLIK